MKRAREETDVDAVQDDAVVGDSPSPAPAAASPPPPTGPATTATTTTTTTGGASTSSPYAHFFEAIFAVTSRRSGSLEAERAALVSRLLGATAASLAAGAAAAAPSSATVTAADVSTLLEDDVAVCLGGFTRELVYEQLARSSEEGSLLRLLTVELVANDGRTLVLAASQTPDTAESASGTSPLLMDVAAAAGATAADGERTVAHPGDFLLLRCQPRPPPGSATSSDDAAASSVACATHAEFVTYNTALFSARDVDLWRDAVEGSIAVVVRWLAALLEQPPGLAQLAFLEAAAASSGAGRAHSSGGEGWRRTLQLPMLLRLRPDAMRGADPEALDRLRRTIQFALRTLLSVFLHVESAMRLPRLCQRLVYLFLASPLFVDGASQVALQLLVSSPATTAREPLTRTLHDALLLGLQHASASDTVAADTALATAELRRSARQAGNGFELLLTRLAHAWLQQSHSGRSKQSAVDVSGAAEAVADVLEAVAATGVLKEVLRWLQLEDDLRRARDRLDTSRRGATTAEDATDTLAELQAPPTLPQMLDGRRLQERAVAEQLSALRGTYNPYLHHEVQRFLRGTALAAYAEVYGSAARAVRRVAKLAGDAAEVGRGRVDGVIAVRLSGVEAVGPRAGGMQAYSLAEVQHHAAFGLPMHLCVRGSRERRHQDETKALLSALQASRVCDTDASLFAYAVVQLNGQWAAFPLVLTHLKSDNAAREKGGSSANIGIGASSYRLTAHVLRDADMLADFVQTSAATAEDGLAQAWVVTGADAAAHQRRGSRRRRAALLSATAAAPPERLLPSGTPALTYLDCLRRLHTLSLSVRQAEAGANGRGRGPAAPSRRPAGAAGATASAGRPFGAGAVSGLWTEHFTDGAVPRQRYTEALTPSVSALLSGTGSAADASSASASATTSLQTLLASVNDAVGFSSAQVEALHSLTAGLSISGAAARATGQDGLPVSVRVVDGCTGSGKTAVLYASALVRGRLHATARQEQQRNVQGSLRQAMTAVKQAVAALRRASVADLFATPAGARGGPSLLDKASDAATEARRQYQLLNEGFLYCATPLLLRPAVATSTVPAAVAEFLFHASDAGSGWPRQGEITSLAALVRESHTRSLNAPLTGQLDTELRRLAGVGAWSGRCRAATAVVPSLLSLSLSARDAADVTSRAAVSSTPAHTWADFIRTDLWPASEVAASLADLDVPGAAAWETLTAAPEERYAPVTMPPTTHLSALSQEQLEGWHSVHCEKQCALAHHLHASVHESVKAVFQLFLDLVWGVAAASQSTRHTLLSSTPTELTQGLLLPYLWCWQPPHLCVDDIDAVQDGFFAMLTPASSFVYSLTSEVPSFQERRRSHERIVLALLRSLRAELQRSGDLTTTALRDSLRCRRGEVQALLRYTIEDARALSKVAAGAGKADAVKTAGAEAAEEDGAGEEDGADAAEPVPGDTDTASPPPVFPGLASYSAVEVWSHGVTMDNSVAADAAAAVFLMEYLASYQRPPQPLRSPGAAISASTPAQIAFGIYTSTAVEAETVAAALSKSALATTPRLRQSVRVWKESLEDAGNETVSAASAVTTAPAAATAPVLYTSLEEAECEAEVGIVCLSGLLQVVVGALHKSRGGGGGGGGSSGADAGSHRPDVRHQQWRQLWAEAADGSPSLFVTRLQWWLWRLLRRVRHGVVLIGSRELFACIPLFSKAESLVQRQRRLMAPKDHRAYWLPPEVGACVLAMVCPEHYKCRRVAVLQEHDAADADTPPPPEEDEEDEEAEEEVVAVRVHGPTECQSLCLQVYDVCPNVSHACLLPCHAQHAIGARAEREAEEDEADGIATGNSTPHAFCTYPCDTTLSCGHMCHRVCGETCEPCTYVGLTELSCGQRVVSGTDGHQALQYAFFPHFQERRCGEPTGLCRTPVSVMCARCGSRALVACHRVTAQLARRQHAAAEEAAAEDASADATTYVLGETACVGCVGLYNKVAKKFGYELLDLPPADHTQSDRAARPEEKGAQEDEDEEEVGGDTLGNPLPRHLLSTEAQAELRREFTISGKKCELLVMKEALEISSGRATDKTEHAVYKAHYDALRATQHAQEKAWREAYQAVLDSWAVRLRQALEVQTALNIELDTLMPRLVAEATEEAEVQRLQFAE